MSTAAGAARWVRNPGKRVPSGRVPKGKVSSVRAHPPGQRCLARNCGSDSFEVNFGGIGKPKFTNAGGSAELVENGPPSRFPPLNPKRDVQTARTIDTQTSSKRIQSMIESISRQIRSRLGRTRGVSLNARRPSGGPLIPGRIVVVSSRRSGLSIVPPWLRVLGTELAAARQAEAAAAASLAGDVTVALPEVPRAPRKITRRMRLHPKGVAALNAVVANQHARAVAALDAARAAEVLRWIPSDSLNPWTPPLREAQRQGLAARATELAQLTSEYPRLVANARGALRPGRGWRHAVIVGGPRVLRTPDVHEILRRGGSQAGVRSYQALATELGSPPG